ncbi:hypothetical protein HYZ97_03490 [Candidatus Pacearchaeota archaeon]|nr:hypothetical protein [Candidatus Pacearchaeota archaeon]
MSKTIHSLCSLGLNIYSYRNKIVRRILIGLNIRSIMSQTFIENYGLEGYVEDRTIPGFQDILTELQDLIDAEKHLGVESIGHRRLQEELSRQVHKIYPEIDLEFLQMQNFSIGFPAREGDDTFWLTGLLLLRRSNQKPFSEVSSGFESGSEYPKALTANFNGLIPNKTREKIRIAKHIFQRGFFASNIYIIKEETDWKGTPVRDPLVVGILREAPGRYKAYLIDQFDTTPLERYVAQEFITDGNGR